MFMFSIFRARNLSEFNLDNLQGRWTLSNSIRADVEVRSVGSSNQLVEGNTFVEQDRMLFDFKLRSNQLDSEQSELRCRVFIRMNSGLVLVDSGGRLVIAHLVLDAISSRTNIEFDSCELSVESLIRIIQQGDLMRLIVATRFGLKDISQVQSIDWDQLVTTPLISAAVSYNQDGPFEVRIGSGSITIYDQRESQVEYVAQLIELHLLNGEDLLESSSPC